ncbi:MAG: hypothetical protein KKF62_03950, partial [Bacteroidetes bacterium]|nr:hypothetical protein [Bacteroidota bacterium]
ILLVVLIPTALVFAQEKFLAKVGNEEISAIEFKKRFEFTPKENNDHDSSKVNFLYSIIAEKLWALEAQSLSLDTIPYVYNSVKNIERKLVKDKLYKIEIESKVKISETEIAEDLPKTNEKRIVNFLFSKRKSEIDSLYNRLVAGELFNSILVNRVEQREQTNGISVIYGQMVKELESEIYSLKLSQFSKPVPINIGWVIYYLKNIEFNQPTDESQITANRKKVEETIFDRKAKIFYNEFFAKYVKSVVVNTDKKLFSVLGDAIFNSFEDKYETLFNENTKKYQLDEYQIRMVKNNIHETWLASNFIKFEVSPISLEKYLTNLELNGLVTDKMSKWGIAQALSSDIKAYIFEEILFREGYSRGLQNLPEIQNELITWKDSFLASYYRYSLLDSVETDEMQAKDYYNKIISENPDSANRTYDEVKEKIKSGLYFKELENLYIDKTVSLAKKYGISVNTELLNSIKVTNIEMMVYRTLGFGGQITAVPYSQSFYKWKYWLPKSLKELLP